MDEDSSFEEDLGEALAEHLADQAAKRIIDVEKMDDAAEEMIEVLEDYRLTGIETVAVLHKLHHDVDIGMEGESMVSSGEE